MKTRFFIFFLMVSNLSLYAQWALTEQTGINSGWSNYNKIETDSNGNPVIIFKLDETIQCMRLNGAIWEHVAPATFNNFKMYQPISLNIDRKNNLIVLYHDETSVNNSCIRFDGSAWKYVGTKDISEEYISPLAQSLAVDTSGVVYLAFNDLNELKIVKESDNSWIPVTTNGLSEYSGFPSLTFNKNNQAYMAFTNLYGKASCYKLEGEKWIPVGNTNISAPSSFTFAMFNKLLFTPDDNIYILCDDIGTSCYKYSSTSNTWILQGTNGLGNGYAYNNDFIADKNSNTYVAIDGLGGDKARCLTFSGNEWIQVGNTPVSENDATNINLAYSNEGIIYAIYNDYLLSKPVVKKYVLTTGNTEILLENSIQVYPNPANEILNIVLSSKEMGWAKLFSLNGQLVMEFEVNTNRKINVGKLNSGSYFLETTTSKGIFHHKIIISH